MKHIYSRLGCGVVYFARSQIVGVTQVRQGNKAHLERLAVAQRRAHSTDLSGHVST